MRAEARHHGAERALEGIHGVGVDLISQTCDAPAGLGTHRNLATHGACDQSGHSGIVVRQGILELRIGVLCQFPPPDSPLSLHNAFYLTSYRRSISLEMPIHSWNVPAAMAGSGFSPPFIRQMPHEKFWT